MRVVSLLPSATEMVCAVGAAAELVGVSHECDFPESIAGRPILTSSRVSVTGTSGEIDRDVRELLSTVLTVYDVDIETLREVDPDVIVTQDLCDVCAVSLSDVEAALKSIARSDVKIVSLKPGRLNDVVEDVRRVGVALGRASEADAAIVDLRARLAALQARSNALESKPHVLTIEWIDPVMVGGTWMPELVEIAGGHALVTQPGDHAPTLDRDALAALDPAPDVVLVKPCGFKLERTETELDDLRGILDGLSWPALASGAVYLADGNAYFNRPGPRLVESAEILAACIHPTEFADLAAKHAASFHAW
jgi:iron complex transport system substrate-binding protein